MKIIKRVLLLFFIGITIFISFFYFSFVKEMRQIYSIVDIRDKNSPHLIRDVIKKLDRNYRSFVIQAYLQEEGTQNLRSIHYKWKLTLCEMMGKTINDEKMIGLYCHYLPFEKGRGMTNSAIFHFARPLPDLTIEQVVTLIAISRSPHGSQERIDDLRQKLLDKYQAE